MQWEGCWVDCEGGILFVGGGDVVFGGQGGERGRSSMGGRSSSMISILGVSVFTLSSTSGGSRRQLGRRQDRHGIRTRTPIPLKFLRPYQSDPSTST